jgi:hypothetical protein
MPNNPLTPTAQANGDVLASVVQQIKELQPGLEKQVEIAAILADLQRLKQLVDNFPADASLNQLLEGSNKGIIDEVKQIQSGAALLSDFGKVLVDLYSLQQALAPKIQEWLDKQLATDSDKEQLDALTLQLTIRVRQLLNYRPDVAAILEDLTAIKNLRGGPADATAFHDFHVLQLAFRSVWLHAFDGNLKIAAAQLYEETVRLYDDAGVTVPPFDAIEDVNQLQEFLNTVTAMIGSSGGRARGVTIGSLTGTGGVTIGPPTGVRGGTMAAAPIPPDVISAYPGVTGAWGLLSPDQQSVVQSQANVINSNVTQDEKDAARKTIAGIVQAAEGRVGRLQKLILELGRALSEPYAFDVFAPDSFNYGLMVTYRQKWEPGEYQAGDLVSTIPLAPSETRKYSKTRIVKKTRAEKEVEKSVSSRSLQSSEISRAESEIMQKATTATNFKLTAHGSFNIGIGSIDSTTEFAANQAQESALNKKSFHEATIKAAEEYRLERSLEVDTSSTVETEETSSGEISNPNNEITVTYLFYELQRRYKIHEFLYRVRPVILIAQEVPSPHEIDEAWLIQYQWILSRVLLDDSFRPALNYLTSGLAGDEVSVQILKTYWEAQAKLTQSLAAC